MKNIFLLSGVPLTTLCSSVGAETFGDVTAASLNAGSASVVGTLNVGGGLGVGGTVVVGGGLGVTGDSGFTGNLSVSQNLGVTGNMNANGVGAQSLTAVTATLGTTNIATLNSGSLGVAGDAGVGRDLAVNRNAGVTGNLAVLSNLGVSGNSYLGGMTVEANSVSANGNTINRVANGVLQDDAVNVSQLNSMQGNFQNQIDKNQKEARSGIAAVAALAAIPNPDSGKKFNVGVGVGNFKSQPALALGGHARISENVTSKIGLGMTSDEKVFSAGIGYSF